jgi:predicted O-methyltransferase YrrM
MVESVDIEFLKRWEFINHRGLPVVQDKEELAHIYNLAKECDSYLEVGSAEGNSLYAVGGALKGNSLSCIDLNHNNVGKHRENVIKLLEDEGKKVTQYLGSSHDPRIVKSITRDYDMVFIDAGHSYPDVIADSVVYGARAKKYIVYHDLVLKEVLDAFNWYVDRLGCRKNTYTFGEKFIIGVIKL